MVFDGRRLVVTWTTGVMGKVKRGQVWADVSTDGGDAPEVTYADISERLQGVRVGDLTWYGVAETGRDMDTDSMIWQRQRIGGAGAVAVRGLDGELD